MSARLRCFSRALALLLCLGTLTKPAVAEDAAGVEFFEKKVRPVLVDNCFTCHSLQAAKLKGGLLLDSRESLLKGGDTGPAIVPGDVEQSLLIKAVRYTDEELQMPPKDKKLTTEQIAALEEWVKMGAPEPAKAPSGAASVATIREKARTHWAFQPVQAPKVPEVRNKKLVRTPVDNFILQRLEAAKLKPSPPADKRTLIRRATFDLIGLPPTPDEVAAFAADNSPDAFAHVVDRLLDSPRYGERWGRHWLDVARYADTKGYVFEEDRHYAYAYTYRDYVIRSFNEDLPFDQFIKEQIAADLLPDQTDKRRLAALGYLTLGRRFVNNIHDIIDDRIDVTCRGMMGLTISCARCHDHKYDPIPARDYYSLYGVFDSSMEPGEEPLLGTYAPEKDRQTYESEHKKRVEERDKFRAEKETAMAAQLRRQSGDYLLATDEVKRTPKPDVDAIARGHQLDPEMLHRWISALERWRKTGQPIFAPWYAFADLPPDSFTNKASELAAKFGTNQDAALNPLVAHAFAGEPPASLEDVADRYGKLFTETDRQWREILTTTNTPPTAFTDAAQENLRQILYAKDAPANLPRDQFDRLYDVPTGQKLRELQRHVEELDASSPGAPPRAMALVDRPKPHDDHILIRGNSDNQGPLAPREFLEILSGPDRKPFRQGSGRLELAEDIASRDNPLTARVLVNRVWLYHFGSPLVSTPSDFGLRSDPPTHPELLDYLAARFVAGGWSVKSLHRLIMLSSAYQQSSDDRADCAKADPNNQLLWRMNRQRLDFEAMRDTLLAVSGKLDLTPGGHAMDITTATSDRRTVYGYVDRQNLPDLFRAFDFASPDTSSPRRFYTTVPQQALFFMNSPFVVEQAKTFANRPNELDLQLPLLRRTTDESAGERRQSLPTPVHGKGNPSSPMTASQNIAAPSRSATNATLPDDQHLRLLYQWAYQRDPSREETAWALQFLHTPPPTNATTPTNWLCGYGAFDEPSARTKAFQPLPYFDGDTFKGGPALPDPKLGWVMLNSGGGHPGNDQDHAAIRRWIAPRDGIIAITGILGHGEQKGDGVRGRIISSQLGLLGQWKAHHKKVDTKLDNITVQRGDTIDFVTDCLTSPDFDTFTWSPTIQFLTDAKTPSAEKTTWNAATDFADAAHALHPSLTPWQKLAQVLLMSDELVFVD